MRTEKEQRKIREDVESVKRKHIERTKEELESVNGGIKIFSQ